MKIIIDEKIPFIKGVLEPYSDVLYLPAADITAKEVSNADGLIIRTRTNVNEELIGNSSVRFVATATIGYDHIDTEYCDDHNIFWTNSPACNSGSVMQYIAACLASLAQENKIRLSQKTLGIVGVGNIGKKVAKLAEILGMKVLLNDPPRQNAEGKNIFCSLDAILQKSDIISLHVPLVEVAEYYTENLVDTLFLEKMKNDAILINTSRGEVVSNKALKQALKTKRIGGAILDVWEKEPDIDPELATILHIATPHIAGYSLDGKSNATAMVVQSASEYFGFPLETWKPQNLELPQNQDFELDCSNKTPEEFVFNAILHTYNIRSESERFLKDLSQFENYRNNYPLRREFGAYKVHLKNSSEEMIEKVKELGFLV